MEEQRYLINGKIYAPDDPGLQEALARIYGTPARPRCLCVDGGVEMYVSRFSGFVIKRMPEAGREHHPTCPSYELPAAASGLGQVLGEAIVDRGPDGVELRLDFPLTRRTGRAAALRDPPSPSDVTVAQKQLSLRGLLHFLWERAGFNRWYPRMQGRRSYWVLRKHLLGSCEGVETKGLRLSERVFIPEPFSLDRAAAISRRHKEALSILLTPDAHAQFQMMVVIGELKELRAATSGYLMVLKHLPGSPFLLEARAGERAKRAFAVELLAWNSGQVRLIAACLIHAKHERCHQVDSLTLMMTSVQWVPLHQVCEKDVVDKLVAEERAFIKPLRYDAKHVGDFPSFLLLDVGAHPIPLDITSALLSDEEQAARARTIGLHQANGWLWDARQGGALPELPPRSVLAASRNPANACPSSARPA